MTIGFSSSTSRPASRQALAWLKCSAWGVTTNAASSLRSYSSSRRSRSGTLGGAGRPASSKIAAASAYASGDGSLTTSMLVLRKSARMVRMRERPAAPHPMMAALTVGSNAMPSPWESPTMRDSAVARPARSYPIPAQLRAIVVRPTLGCNTHRSSCERWPRSHANSHGIRCRGSCESWYTLCLLTGGV